MQDCPQSVIDEAARVKDYFPFRIVFICKDKDTNKFNVYAKPTMHTANRLARAGHDVAIFTRNQPKETQ